MADAVPRLSWKAVAGVALACLVLPGPFAALLGLSGLREINQSEGAVRGRGFAVAGMVLGVLSTLVIALGILTVTVYLPLREQAHRTNCQNRLRLIGLGLNSYHDAHGAFPPGTLPPRALPPDRRLSWCVGVLPVIKQGDLYDRFDLGQPWDAPANGPAVATAVPTFHCPSAPAQAPRGEPAWTQFVGMAGVGADAAELPEKSPLAGVFGYDRRTTRDDVTRGVSTTISVVETAQDNGPWAAGGPATVRGLDPARRPYVGWGRPFGGLHPGGMNVLFVGGRAQFMAESAAPEVLESLATIRSEGP